MLNFIQQELFSRGCLSSSSSFGTHSVCKYVLKVQFDVCQRRNDSFFKPCQAFLLILTFTEANLFFVNSFRLPVAV